MIPPPDVTQSRHQIRHFYARQGYVACKDQKPLELTEAFIMSLLGSHGLWRESISKHHANNQRLSKGGEQRDTGS